MIRRIISRNSVALTGSVIGIVSIAPGWLTLKPNRIVSGTSMNLWDVGGWNYVSVILGLWLVCLVISLAGGGKRQAAILGTAANSILIITFVLAGLFAGRLLEGEAAFARVSLGAGVWITAAAAYILIYAARQGLDSSRAWRGLISWVGPAVIAALLISGWFNHLSIIQEFMGREERFTQELLRHILLFGGSVAVGILIGIPLGVWAARSKRAERPIFYIANITQTIPSLALFGLLIAPLSALSFAFPVLREFGIRGVGAAPAVIALVIYSLLPIIRNTYVGLRQLDPAVIDAGLGMGMSRRHLFRKIEVPLAAPLILEGVRMAAVQSVGLATVAALIGAGGLGWFVFQGIGQAADDLILLGAIPIIILALVVDAVMRNIIRLATPRGIVGGGP